MTKIFIKTYGCSLNKSDSEAMAGILAKKGFEIVNDESTADLMVINSCTVKSNPEQRLFYELRNAKKPIVVAGCVPQADPNNEIFKDFSVIGTKAISKISEAVKSTLEGRVVHYLGDEDGDSRLEMPIINTSGIISIIPINSGCLSNCSYCKTKQARGDLHSYPLRLIEKNFRSAVNNGFKEIWLTSQDTGAYGLDINSNIIGLLKTLLKKQGDYRIRLGMANPQYVLPRINEFKEVLSNEHMFRFLHIPVQSGSNNVLRDMRRGYKAESFKKIVLELTRAIPDLTIATDIIVGFPTETEDDFQETVDLIKTLKIPVVNISKFYPRPGTEAAKMKLLPTNIVKQRSTYLKKICDQIANERNKEFVNKELSVIVDEPGKKPGTLIARADNYLQVIIPESMASIGDRLKIRPNTSSTFDVRLIKE